MRQVTGANARIPAAKWIQRQRVYRGGENNIAVFSIDPNTGEPTLVQNADPQSFHVRTFSIDPSGRMMVAASIADMSVRDGNNVRHVPAALTVFRIGNDGKLTFVSKYDVELGGKFSGGRGSWIELSYKQGGRRKGRLTTNAVARYFQGEEEFLRRRSGASRRSCRK